MQGASRNATPLVVNQPVSSGMSRDLSALLPRAADSRPRARALFWWPPRNKNLCVSGLPRSEHQLFCSIYSAPRRWRMQITTQPSAFPAHPRLGRFRRVSGRPCLLWLDQRRTLAPSSLVHFILILSRPFFPFFSFFPLHIYNFTPIRTHMMEQPPNFFFPFFLFCFRTSAMFPT